MRQSWFNRSAKVFVNFSGICWVMIIGGVFGGRASRTSLSASVPPVEAPMATIVSVVLIMAPEAARREAWGVGDGSPPVSFKAVRFRFAQAAALIFQIRSRAR